MEIGNVLGIILRGALLAVFVAGLIEPRWVLRWSKKPTRWKVVGWWFLIMLILLAVLPMKTSEKIISETVKDKEVLSDMKKHNLTKLVVKDIPLYNQFSFKPIFVDENDKEVVLPDDINSWFENISSPSLTMPKGTSITAFTPSHLSIAGKIIFAFVLDGKEYSMEIGIGSVLVVSRTNRGKYKLFPEETANLLTD